MNYLETLYNVLHIKPNNSGVFVSGKEPLSGNCVEHIVSQNPADGSVLAHVQSAQPSDYEWVMRHALSTKNTWLTTPAPQRGQIVRKIGEQIRQKKEHLAKLITLEMGKTHREALGEVQEMIDMAEFAVGLSRQLYGTHIVSERPMHRIVEQWHPLGVVGIITAFNFPMAVWSWNAFLAAICGNVCIWKPSPKTPLCAIALQGICHEVCLSEGVGGVFSVIIGHNECIGNLLVSDPRVDLISFTGSTEVGRTVNQCVAQRLGKILLELGGNNALIVDDSAQMDLVIPTIVFGAIGTAGQRCTSTRRLLIHEKVYHEVVQKLVLMYQQLKIGNPMDKEVHMGPLIDAQAVITYQKTIEEALMEGGKVLFGNKILGGNYVLPTLIEANNAMTVLQHERFVPVLYVLKFSHIEEALRINNSVKQGLSSAIFTQNLKNSELFISVTGSDCGIANVNTGTSGAEIGGAFGGEKETGGGREAGSDAWKAYMRRQTSTINYGNSLPLAQGIRFDI